MGQGITYCGVNARIQNGRAEKAIRDLQTMARKMLLHAKGQWPEEIHLSMWPYALQMAIRVHNNVPNAANASRHELASAALGTLLCTRMAICKA